MEVCRISSAEGKEAQMQRVKQVEEIWKEEEKLGRRNKGINKDGWNF